MNHVGKLRKISNKKRDHSKSDVSNDNNNNNNNNNEKIFNKYKNPNDHINEDEDLSISKPYNIERIINDNTITSIYQDDEHKLLNQKEKERDTIDENINLIESYEKEIYKLIHKIDSPIIKDDVIVKPEVDIISPRSRFISSSNIQKRRPSKIVISEFRSPVTSPCISPITSPCISPITSPSISPRNINYIKNISRPNSDNNINDSITDTSNLSHGNMLTNALLLSSFAKSSRQPNQKLKSQPIPRTSLYNNNINKLSIVERYNKILNGETTTSESESSDNKEKEQEQMISHSSGIIIDKSMIYMIDKDVSFELEEEGRKEYNQ